MKFTMQPHVLDAITSRLRVKFVKEMALAIQEAEKAGATPEEGKEMGFATVVALIEAAAQISQHLDVPYEKFIQLAACADKAALTPGQRTLHDVIHRIAEVGIDRLKVGVVEGAQAMEMLQKIERSDPIDKIIEQASARPSQDKPN